ncbi:hypothetical protein CK496_11100 [Enterococcus thailandicus]|nr:hypothetical protein CK496_11100 [Enterococcus thailandicus]
MIQELVTEKTLWRWTRAKPSRVRALFMRGKRNLSKLGGTVYDFHSPLFIVNRGEFFYFHLVT